MSLPGEAAPEEVLRRPPREGLDCLVDEDGSYRPASAATPGAAGRQVWGPPFPERRQKNFEKIQNYFLLLFDFISSLN